MIGASQQPQDAVEDGQRMGRTSRNEEIDRNDAACAVMLLGVINVRPTGNRAGAHGDHDLGRRHGLVGLLQSQRMFCVTGPVISSPSACRGEATN